MPVLTSPKAANWVDRGEPPEPTLRRILAFYFDRHDAADEPWLTEHATAIRGLVEADASEVHVAAYPYRVLRAGLAQSLAHRGAAADAGDNVRVDAAPTRATWSPWPPEP